MEKKIVYKILPDKKLILEYYQGVIIMDDFIAKNRIVSELEAYDPRYNSILDFRNAYIIVGPEEMMKYFDFMKTNPEIYARRKTAYLTNRPDDEVVNDLFKLLMERDDLLMSYKIFTEMNDVLSWFDQAYLKEDFVESVYAELCQCNTMVVREPKF